jgi:hypothetical protein
MSNSFEVLEEVLSSIARVLGHPEAWHSPLAGLTSSRTRVSSSDWVAWFLGIARSRVGREVFREVRGKPCRFLLDSLDEARARRLLEGSRH